MNHICNEPSSKQIDSLISRSLQYLNNVRQSREADIKNEQLSSTIDSPLHFFDRKSLYHIKPLQFT